ncbi:MAG: hypothetical protein ACKPFA_14005 [Dolichospermum sp.]
MTTTNNAPISFRLTDDELELLRQYQEDGEKSLNLTAKRLLLSALGVDTKKPSLQFVNTVDTNQIKELIEVAVQEKLTEFTTVDNVDTIKNLIAESLADGDIKDAIATSYAAVIGQFNGLLEQLQELQKQVQELKSVPPAAVPQSPANEELTTDNKAIPPNLNHQEIIDLLKINHIIDGTKYDKNSLLSIKDNLIENKERLEKDLNIKLSLEDSKYIVREFNKIVKALGYDLQNKQIQKIETYWVKNQ